MQVQRTDLSPTEVQLTITATEAELKPIKDGVVARLGKNVKLPGFREGKAPQNLIEKNIDQNLLQGDFLDEAMTQLYAKATAQEDLRPVTRPEVTIKKFVPYTELEYEVKTSVIGPVKLADYKKITAKRDPVNITAKDIDGVIDSLRQRMAERKEVKRAAKANDETVIDFKGVDAKGAAFEGGSSEDYSLTLGSGTFIPGFEDEVIGMKPGEEKSFPITFPKDYGAKDLAGQKVTFTVTIKKINELVSPKADDEFAAKVGPFKSLADLKEDIKKQLTAEKEREVIAKQQDEIVKAVAAKSKVEIPQSLIDQQIVYNIDELRRDLMYRGQTYEEYLKAEGKTEEEYKKELIGPATDQLKISLILSEIADKENLTIEPDELSVRLQLLKQQYNDPQMQAELDKPENQRDIASRMLTEKVLDLLVAA